MNDFIPIKGRMIDITGHRFGKLVALGPTGRIPCGKIKWLCQCDCGNTTEVIASSLRKGSTLSCGCLANQLSSIRSKTHGMSQDRLYHIWHGMIDRCRNPNNKGYAHYGGRNISVCNEWLQSFEQFYSDVSILQHCGEEGYSIDRVDNDGNYEPGNVKWSTQAEQGRNQRSNIILTYNDKSQCVADWAAELGFPAITLYKRLYRGWTTEKTLTVPLRSRPRKERR